MLGGEKSKKGNKEAWYALKEAGLTFTSAEHVDAYLAISSRRGSRGWRWGMPGTSPPSSPRWTGKEKGQEGAGIWQVPAVSGESGDWEVNLNRGMFVFVFAFVLVEKTHLKLACQSWYYFMEGLYCEIGLLNEGQEGDRLKKLGIQIYQGDLLYGIRDERRRKAKESNWPIKRQMRLKEKQK